ncbi:hypothetical protein POSPLADRAFT_1154420, partial [Postia placenta MAD-698-R-SB12]
FCHRIGVGGGVSMSPCRGRLRGTTLSALGGTEDVAGAEAAVVAFRRLNFERSECSSGLSAESAVKAPEKVRWGGHVRQGLLTWGRALSARRAEQDPRTRTPRLLLHSHSPQAQALAQDLEGDLLALDRDRRRQFEGDGSWGKQGENAARQIETRGCCGDRGARVILLDRSGCPIGARLLLATIEDSLRAVWDVDVDEVLGVECVDLALAGSHDGWGEDGKVRGQEVETEVPRAAEAGLYTGDGRLCALVRAQLVCAQHADAAPGAGESERLCQRSPSCAVRCRPI